MAGESEEVAPPRERWWSGLFATRAELFAAGVLSLAALLTSWAGFQAALWDGEQAANYTRAGNARTEATRLATQNGQAEAIDLFLFSQWLNAYAAGEPRLEQFYRKRFRSEFRIAFEAWLERKPTENPAAPPTPFAMPEYSPHLRERAQAKSREADALFEEGQRCNDVSDAFVQATVILAIALFLGGIGQTFKKEKVVLGLNVLALLACFVGIFKLLWLPALRL